MTALDDALDAVFAAGPVIAVLTIVEAEQAVPLARALVMGGVRALEVTLRTPVALDAVARISGEVENAIVGVGTVRRPGDVEAATRAGARFAVSPGLTTSLAEFGLAGPIPLLPGVATATELMRALEFGFSRLKFFPAESAGGVRMLNAFGAPFPEARFCATGGVTLGNAASFMACENVICVGGGWLAPPQMVRAGLWAEINANARASVAASRAV